MRPCGAASHLGGRFSAARLNWSVGTTEPLQPPRFLRRGRSPKSAISELGFYKATVGELTQPAISRRRDVPKTALINGWFVPVTRR